MSYHGPLGIIITGYGGLGRYSGFGRDATSSSLEEQRFLQQGGSLEFYQEQEAKRRLYEQQRTAAAQRDALEQQKRDAYEQRVVVAKREQVARENALIAEVAPTADAFEVERVEERIRKTEEQIAKERQRKAVVSDTGELLHPIDPGRNTYEHGPPAPMTTEVTSTSPISPSYQTTPVVTPTPVIPTTPVTAPTPTVAPTTPTVAPTTPVAAAPSMLPLVAGLAVAAFFLLR